MYQNITYFPNGGTLLTVYGYTAGEKSNCNF